MHSLLYKSLFSAVAMLLLVLRWSVVDAQPTSVGPTSYTENQLASAKKLTQQAIKAEDAKKYVAAIALYQRAYQFVQHPTLLFNIGRVHRLAGNPFQTGKFYKRYLADAPDGPHASEAREFLASLPASIYSDLPQTVDNDLPPGMPTADSLRATPPEMPTADSLRARVERAKRVKNISFILMSTGGVACIAAIGFSRQEIRGNDKHVLGAGLLGAGLVLSGLFAYGYSTYYLDKAGAIAWTPMLGTGFTGIAWTGTLP